MDRTALDKELPFVVRAKGAQSVAVTGDFTQWSKEGIRLRRRSPDEWEATLRLSLGEYQYRLLVDGRWQDDSRAPRRVPNPFGSESCTLQVTR